MSNKACARRPDVRDRSPDAEPGAVDRALTDLLDGDPVIVVDAGGGDLIAAAVLTTARTVSAMDTHARGLTCVALPAARLAALAIPPMAHADPKGSRLAMHAGVHHREGDGVSARERATTIRVLGDARCEATDFHRPGHVFPIAADDAGVLGRRGRVEAAVDLVAAAGLTPAATVCRILGPDGEPADRAALEVLAQRLGIALVTPAEVAVHRHEHDGVGERMVEARMPLPQGMFRAVGFRDGVRGHEHLALLLGDPVAEAAPLVRIHLECVAGDAFFSTRCDCGLRLERALDAIAEAGSGALIYLRESEGRAADPFAHLQREPDAAPVGSLSPAVAAQILDDLGLRRVRLLVGEGEELPPGLGIEVVEQLPLALGAIPHTARRGSGRGPRPSLAYQATGSA